MNIRDTQVIYSLSEQAAQELFQLMEGIYGDGNRDE
jgi:hypothetical protein